MNIHFLFPYCLILSLILAPLSGATQLSMGLATNPAGTALTNNTNTPIETKFLVTNVDLADNINYLPMVVKNFPIIPTAPVLDAISNTDGDGNYTVSWSLFRRGRYLYPAGGRNRRLLQPF